MPAAQLKQESSDEIIAKALLEVNSTAQRWSEALNRDQAGDDATAEAAQARTQLIGKVWSLYSAIKGPADMIHDHLEKVCAPAVNPSENKSDVTRSNSSATLGQCAHCLPWVSLMSCRQTVRVDQLSNSVMLLGWRNSFWVRDFASSLLNLCWDMTG